ncbi:hypothetical protein D9758_018036 [Tetrapyrgos nigripes]|uniref:CCHC-type domain-containing protein n=1 Tax=Tetrapyrgos nigripes TaxID=182062 RepID=A0A8H5CBB4_9AGAR|nr:hypothetical protein D9758_018036 [Tetrapyrgos nigripes]
MQGITVTQLSLRKFCVNMSSLTQDFQVLPSDFASFKAEDLQVFVPSGQSYSIAPKISSLCNTSVIQGRILVEWLGGFASSGIFDTHREESEFGEAALLEFYQDGLPPKLREAVGRTYPKWDDFEEYKERAVELHLEWLKERERQGRWKTTSTSKSSPGPGRTVASVNALMNMGPGANLSSNPLPKLTPDERDRLRKLGACFTCRQTGHMSNECPTYPRTSSQNTSQTFPSSLETASPPPVTVAQASSFRNTIKDISDMVNRVKGLEGEEKEQATIYLKDIISKLNHSSATSSVGVEQYTGQLKNNRYKIRMSAITRNRQIPSITLKTELIGKVTGRKIDANALIDSSAEGIIINGQFTQKHQLTLLPIKNVDGSENTMGWVREYTIQNLRIYSQNSEAYHEEKAEFYVTDIGDHNIILGTDWLEHNPTINWSDSRVDMTRCPETCITAKPPVLHLKTKSLKSTVVNPRTHHKDYQLPNQKLQGDAVEFLFDLSTEVQR